MTTTPNLLLPNIEGSQSQKHVTHNAALQFIDLLLMAAVKDRDLAAPPGSPVEGDRYLIAGSATGVWSGHSGQLAGYYAGQWIFGIPVEGWRIWVMDEDIYLTYDGAAWVADSASGSFSILGVNTTADATNKLSVASSAILFNHIGNSIQVKLNKNATGDSASFLFQTGFSGRAEIGTTGDDSFHFKVSPDGTSWTDAIVIDKTTGNVALPATALGDVSGPASSTNNALARFSGATGKVVQGAAILVNDDGELRLPSVTGPSAPTADTLQLAAMDYAGRQSLASRTSAGAVNVLQSSLARNKVGLWNPPGSSATLPGIFGIVAPVPLGTATTRGVATSNLLTRMRRLGYVSAATAGSFAGHYVPGNQFTIGDGAGLGGFLLVIRFGVSDGAGVSGARMFVGLRNGVSAPSNTEPSALTNVIALAQLSSSANLQIVYGGSAAQTPIDLGSDFPAGTLSADAYELVLSAQSGSQTVGYRVERLNTGHVAAGTLAGTAGTALPAASTLLSHAVWRCNNATALAVGIDIASVYIETDA